LRLRIQDIKMIIQSLKRINRPLIRSILQNRYNTLNITRKNATVISAESKAPKVIGTWLLGVSAGVAGAVVIGGITRITRSGLSMTDWHLIRGMKPPRTQDEWLAEFERYKSYPEFYVARSDMTLSEFKSIFFWEYVHRMWGRGIGLMFIIPCVTLWARKYFNKGMKIRVGIYGSLILGQGLLGWYMVKSGLDEQTLATTAHPRVSQYRLASHLGLAFMIYSLTFYQSLAHILKDNQLQVTKELRLLRKFAHGSLALVYVTAVSGAFVAGIDGGLVYNSFPKFADRWIPSDIAALNPWWKNMFENPTTTQFNHRLLGTTTVSTITATWLMSRGVVLPGRAKMAANCLFLMSGLQIGLGVSTLLLYVPKELAVTHQFGSLTLLSLALWFARELKIPK